MSLLEEEPSMKNFSEVIQQLSKSSQEGIQIAMYKFDEFARRKCEGRSGDKVIEYIKKLPSEKQEPKLFLLVRKLLRVNLKENLCHRHLLHPRLHLHLKREEVVLWQLQLTELN